MLYGAEIKFRKILQIEKSDFLKKSDFFNVLDFHKF